MQDDISWGLKLSYSWVEIPMRFFKSALSHLLDFIYPASCMLCGLRLETDSRLCQDCIDHLLTAVDVRVHQERSEFVHLTGPIHFDGVVTCWPLIPEIETLIHAAKYQRSKSLAIQLGHWAGAALLSTLNAWDIDCIIPVPLHRKRIRHREYNQSSLICRGLSDSFSLPVREDVLVRHRNTRTQTKLDATRRQENVRGAFSVHMPEMNIFRRILLLDDVVTTGATINACAATLKEAGVEQVWGVALARPRLIVESL